MAVGMTENSLNIAARVRTNRLLEDEVAYAHQQRLKEIHMWSIIREILIYFCFLSVLFPINYSNRPSTSFLQVNHLKKYLSHSRQTDFNYTKISTINEYWEWLENSFVSNIRAQQWYNGDAPRNISGYINDKSNRLIGWGIMRQLRVKSSVCSSKILHLTCHFEYNFLNEETNLFEPGWKNETTIKCNSSICQSFEYQSSEQLDTYVVTDDHGSYSGGGYVYQFRCHLSDILNNLTILHQFEWIDSRTRAIIIQLSLYNPNVELFTSVTFLMEFLSTDGIYPQVQLESMNFSVFPSLVELICLIIYMLMIVYFIWIEMKLLLNLKWKYFSRFWSFIEIGLIVCSWSSVGIYIWRNEEYKRIAKLFETTNGYVYT